MNFQRILELILVSMKDYEQEGSEQMEHVWGFYVGTGFYI